MHVLSANPWDKSAKKFGDYKQAHTLEKTDPRWLHAKEVRHICLLPAPSLKYNRAARVAPRQRGRDLVLLMHVSPSFTSVYNVCSLYSAMSASHTDTHTHTNTCARWAW